MIHYVFGSIDGPQALFPLCFCCVKTTSPPISIGSAKRRLVCERSGAWGVLGCLDWKVADSFTGKAGDFSNKKGRGRRGVEHGVGVLMVFRVHELLIWMWKMDENGSSMLVCFPAAKRKCDGSPVDCWRHVNFCTKNQSTSYLIWKHMKCSNHTAPGGTRLATAATILGTAYWIKIAHVCLAESLAPSLFLKYTCIYIYIWYIYITIYVSICILYLVEPPIAYGLAAWCLASWRLGPVKVLPCPRSFGWLH